MSENLPKASDTEIKVNLVLPDSKSITELDSVDDEQCISKVVETLWQNQNIDQTEKKPIQAFLCKISGNLIWSMWFSAGQETSFTYKYEMTWPDGRQVYVS